MTPKMKEALDFIRAYLADYGGVAPSFENMRVALDLASKSNVYRLMDELEERGYITRFRGQARSIQLTAKALALGAIPSTVEMAGWSTSALYRHLADVRAVIAAVERREAVTA
jgi:repressor LexA